MGKAEGSKREGEAERAVGCKGVGVRSMEGGRWGRKPEGREREQDAE